MTLTDRQRERMVEVQTILHAALSKANRQTTAGLQTAALMEGMVHGLSALIDILAEMD